MDIEPITIKANPFMFANILICVFSAAIFSLFLWLGLINHEYGVIPIGTVISAILLSVLFQTAGITIRIDSNGIRYRSSIRWLQLNYSDILSVAYSPQHRVGSKLIPNRLLISNDKYGWKVRKDKEIYGPGKRVLSIKFSFLSERQVLKALAPFLLQFPEKLKSVHPYYDGGKPSEDMCDTEALLRSKISK